VNIHFSVKFLKSLLMLIIPCVEQKSSNETFRNHPINFFFGSDRMIDHRLMRRNVFITCDDGIHTVEKKNFTNHLM